MCRILPVLLAAACGAPAARAPAAPPAEGISIAIYAGASRSYGVVDDRRWIDVADGSVLLDRIDPSAALQSLVIEPIGDDPIRIASCVRERVDHSPEALAALANARGERPRRIIVLHDMHDPSPQRFHFEDTTTMEPAIPAGAGVLSPIVRCRVQARPGKHLVRVLHVTSSLAFRAEHAVTMTSPDRATVATTFALVTPAWRERAQVTLWGGVPGDDPSPTELARGPIVLDGSTAILGGQPRALPARLRSIYDGVKLDDDDDDIRPNDIAWGRRSRRQVWVWFELAEPATLPPGRVRAHVELPHQPPRDVEVAADVRQPARWPMWIDDDLLGSRRRTVNGDGATITDRLELGVSNLGTASREVWIEERLRPAKRRTLGRAWPKAPALAGDAARAKLVLAPGQTQRLDFTIDYEF